MEAFTYKGISEGKYVDGEIEALNLDEASHKLKEQKVIITNIARTSKKKKAEFKSFYVAGNKIYVFLKNSYYLKLDIFGKIEKINKLPSDIFTDPIFINDTIFYLNKKNNLLIVN